MLVAEAVICLKGVALDYGGDEVVRDVDLNVNRGETKINLGPSSVGKSTILKAVLGLLKPKCGEIHILGREISKLSEKELV